MSVIKALLTFPDKQGGEKPELWVDFPISKEHLKEIASKGNIHQMSGAEVKEAYCHKEISGFADYISGAVDVNELNYLAVKVSELDEESFDKLGGVLESGRHRGGLGEGNGELADIINIIENLNSFEFFPNFDAEEYGNLLLDDQNNAVQRIIHRLNSSDSELLDTFIQCLIDNVDVEGFGQAMANENDGEFLDSGYLIEEGAFHDIYSDLTDIPDEYIIWEETNSFTKVLDVDLPTLLVEMHAISGNYTQDAVSNLQNLMSGDSFIMVNAEKLTVLSAQEVFHTNSPQNMEFQIACESSDIRVFFAALNKGEGSDLLGSIHEIDTDTIKNEVSKLKISAVNIDVEFKDGTNQIFTPKQWQDLSDEERGRSAGLLYRYDYADEKRLDTFLENLHNSSENDGRAIPATDFLADLNTGFMERSQNPQPDMIRVAREAAKIMLARSDADVYRLMPEGAVKLSPLDVIKSGGLWFSEHREFAVKQNELAGLEKWAKRTTNDIMRQSMRKEHNKSHDKEI